MNKIILVSLFLAMSILLSHAEQVTPEKAQAKAIAFLNQQSTIMKAPRRAGTAMRLVQVWPSTTNMAAKTKLRASSMGGADFYIFNTADSTAFVIVSGESTTEEILAYSFDGAFSLDNMAPAAEDILNAYAEQIQKVKSGAAKANVRSSINVKASTRPATLLLNTANWDQNSPFNDLCPPGTPTGCVATAMAICMKYSSWPPKGVGSKNGYNFGTSTYNWASMSSGNSWASDWTPTGKAEVAKIMRHCGASVSMGYSQGGSMASNSTACEALKYHFRYPHARFMWSANDDGGRELLQIELAANRPILFGGNSSNGEGHAFVCDGYDNSGKFHFNLGWGGSSNGYYVLTNICGYNANHLIFGLTPETSVETNATLSMGLDHLTFRTGLSLGYGKSIAVGTPFTVSASGLETINNGTYTGKGAVALFTSDGTMRGFISTPIEWTKKGYVLEAKNISCTIPASMGAVSTDRIWFVESTNGGSTWNKVYSVDDETTSLAMGATGPSSGINIQIDQQQGVKIAVYGEYSWNDLTNYLQNNNLDLTELDLTEATNVSSKIDLSSMKVNPNCVVKGTSAQVVGALTNKDANIVLTDECSVYGDGWQTPASITYSRIFNAGNSQSTKKAPRWQTINVPFDVNTVTYNGKTFAVTDFWLYELTSTGYKRVRTGNLKASVPYLIAFANAPEFASEGINVSGTVTFTGNNTPFITEYKKSESFNGYHLMGHFAILLFGSQYYELNEAGTEFVQPEWVIYPFKPYLEFDNAADAQGITSIGLEGLPTAIESISAAEDGSTLQVTSPSEGALEISAAKKTYVRVYTASGLLIGAFSVESGNSVRMNVPAGIYVINSQKILVE